VDCRPNSKRASELLLSVACPAIPDGSSGGTRKPAMHRTAGGADPTPISNSKPLRSSLPIDSFLGRFERPLCVRIGRIQEDAGKLAIERYSFADARVACSRKHSWFWTTAQCTIESYCQLFCLLQLSARIVRSRSNVRNGHRRAATSQAVRRQLQSKWATCAADPDRGNHGQISGPVWNWWFRKLELCVPAKPKL
jgi:hypothetical protein